MRHQPAPGFPPLEPHPTCTPLPASTSSNSASCSSLNQLPAPTYTGRAASAAAGHTRRQRLGRRLGQWRASREGGRWLGLACDDQRGQEGGGGREGDEAADDVLVPREGEPAAASRARGLVSRQQQAHTSVCMHAAAGWAAGAQWQAPARGRGPPQQEPGGGGERGASNSGEPAVRCGCDHAQGSRGRGCGGRAAPPAGGGGAPQHLAVQPRCGRQRAQPQDGVRAGRQRHGGELDSGPSRGRWDAEAGEAPRGSAQRHRRERARTKISRSRNEMVVTPPNPNHSLKNQTYLTLPCRRRRPRRRRRPGPRS
jgi:hypothetical protein